VTQRKGAKARLRLPGEPAPANDPSRLTRQSNGLSLSRVSRGIDVGSYCSDDPAEACPDAAKGYDDAGSSGDSARQLDHAFVRLCHIDLKPFLARRLSRRSPDKRDLVV
jgi:hypothetical protein